MHQLNMSDGEVTVKMTSRSHQGLVRINNEDRVYCDPVAQFAVLADGMGGLLAGEVASEVAVETACDLLLDATISRASPEDLRAVSKLANQAVVKRAEAMRYLGKMGTTMVIFARHKEQSFFAHTGDSRLYTYASGILTQITSDHTLAQQMVEQGKLTEAEAFQSSKRHVLTQAIGLPGVFAADVGEVPACERILICSDGLSDLVESDEIQDIMATLDLEECTNLLLKAALDRGGRDNVTVALIEF